MLISFVLFAVIVFVLFLVILSVLFLVVSFFAFVFFLVIPALQRGSSSQLRLQLSSVNQSRTGLWCFFDILLSSVVVSL